MGTVRTLLLVASLAVLAVGSAMPPTTSARPVAAMILAPKGAAGPDTRAPETAGDATSDARLANECLDELRATHRYLDGATVTMGTTPHDEEAVAYYTSGEIVINRAHTVSIDKILAHEIWHIIDWRDNGRLDWKENVPPSDSSAYVRR